MHTDITVLKRDSFSYGESKFLLRKYKLFILILKNNNSACFWFLSFICEPDKNQADKWQQKAWSHLFSNTRAELSMKLLLPTVWVEQERK